MMEGSNNNLNNTRNETPNNENAIFVIRNELNRVNPVFQIETNDHTSVDVDTKAYVQSNKHFIETTKEKILINHIIPKQSARNTATDNSVDSLVDRVVSPIDVAISIQKKSQTLGVFCYGLLGGISLMQLVLTTALLKDSRNELFLFLDLYSKFANVPSASFSVLTVLCLVFAFDRIDVVRIKTLLQQEVVHFSNLILVGIYALSLLLSILCFKYDEIIIFYPDTKNSLISQDIKIWETLNFWRCIFGIIGWIIVCVSRTNNLLEERLKYIKGLSERKGKNAETVSK